MVAGENDGYDTILHKISRYDTIRYTAPKSSAICNGQQSKINAAFSPTPSHAFACVQTPSTVDSIQTLSIIFSSVRTWGTAQYQKSSINRFQSHSNSWSIDGSTAVAHCRTPSTTFDACKRGEHLIALLEFISIFTDIRTLLMTSNVSEKST